MVSIVIINYNTFDLTKACISSIIEKTKTIEYEIILVDNASTEKDPNLFRKKFADIQLVKSDQNLGFAKGNNLGIQQASGKYILLLNSDTELINNAVKEAMIILESDINIGALCGQLQDENGIAQAAAGRFPYIKHELYELFRICKLLSSEKRKSHYLGTQANYNTPFESDWVSGAFFMFRKKDLEKFPNGKLHDDFFMYFEDVQWCHYIKKVVKKKICYSPMPKVLHHNGGSDTTKNGNVWKYFNVALPNEYKWMILEKGWIYTKLYYLTKSLHYFSLRNRSDARKANRFLRVVVKGIQ